MVFCYVIGDDVASGYPVNDELFLFDPVFDPVKPHVDFFGSSLLDCVVNETNSCRVVDLHRGGKLWMSHF